jgi:ABC-type polar amino acid transport system ATPase subunit
MSKIVGIITLLFVGALVVLVLTHASGFATAVASGGTFVDNSARILTGSTSGGLAKYPA